MNKEHKNLFNDKMLSELSASNNLCKTKLGKEAQDFISMYGQDNKYLPKKGNNNLLVAVNKILGIIV